MSLKTLLAKIQLLQNWQADKVKEWSFKIIRVFQLKTAFSYFLLVCKILKERNFILVYGRETGKFRLVRWRDKTHFILNILRCFSCFCFLSCFCLIKPVWSQALVKYFKFKKFWALILLKPLRNVLKFVMRVSQKSSKTIRGVFLTHFSPVSHFYTPWKRQKIFGFLTFLGGIEMWHWTKMS